MEPEHNGHRPVPNFVAQMSAAAELLRRSDAPSLFESHLDIDNSSLLYLWQRQVASPSAAHLQNDDICKIALMTGPSPAPDSAVATISEDATGGITQSATGRSIESVPVLNTVGNPCSLHRTRSSESCVLPTRPQSHPKVAQVSSPTEKRVQPKRRVYTSELLHKLRHIRQLDLPLDDPVTLTNPKNKTLPVLSFTPSETLTADVLLVGDDARAKFSDLQLSPALLSALPSAGFETPSPIQIRTIPRARLGCDIIAHAKSGTGKTAAYGVATLDTQIQGNSFLSSSGRPHTLVLVPTRELAIQTAEVFRAIAAHVLPPVSVTTLVGGVSEQSDDVSLATSPPHVVVGTPGRIRSLADSNSLTLNAVSAIVLDEADRLLSRAFESDVCSIIDSLPHAHQTLAFSATFPPWLRRMLMNIMRKPAYITDSDNSNRKKNFDEGVAAAQQAILLGVRQCKVVTKSFAHNPEQCCLLGPSKKADVVVRLLQKEAFNFCMVFYNFKKQLGKLEVKIARAGFSCKRMSGDVSQRERNKIMDAVSNGTVRVVVATDLLARGIDIKSCDLVVQCDVPSEVETYLHRVGRAGRFGRQGRSFLVCHADEEQAGVALLEAALGYTLQNVTLPDMVAADANNNGGLKGKDKTESRATPGELLRREMAFEEVHGGTNDSGIHEEIKLRDSCADGTLNGWSLAVTSEKKGIDQENSEKICLETAQPQFGEESGTPGHINAPEDSYTKLWPSFSLENRNDFLKKNPSEGTKIKKRTKMGHPTPMLSDDNEKHSCGTEDGRNDCVEDQSQTKRMKSANTSLHTEEIQTKFCNKIDGQAVGTNWIHLMDGRLRENDKRWEAFAEKAWWTGYNHAYEQALRMASELSSRLND